MIQLFSNNRFSKLKDEVGSALFELALSLPISLVLLSGCFGIGDMLREHQVVSHAIKLGARAAISASNDSCDNLDVIAREAVDSYLQTAGLAELVDKSQISFETHEIPFVVSETPYEEASAYFTTIKVFINEPMSNPLSNIFGSFGINDIKSSASYVLEQVCTDA